MGGGDHATEIFSVFIMRLLVQSDSKDWTWGWKLKVPDRRVMVLFPMGITLPQPSRMQSMARFSN